jgi:hypothetical protein
VSHFYTFFLFLMVFEPGLCFDVTNSNSKPKNYRIKFRYPAIEKTVFFSRNFVLKLKMIAIHETSGNSQRPFNFCEAKSRGRVIPILPVATVVKPRQLRGFYSGFGGQAWPERPGGSRGTAIIVS